MRVAQLRRSLRRTVHFVPGAAPEKYLAKATAADTLILDLEDSVSSDQKQKARDQVKDWIARGVCGTGEVGVRINPRDSPTGWKDDLHQTLSAKGPDLYMVPKVKCLEDLEELSAELSQREAAVGKEVGSTLLLPIATEVPEAVFNLSSIASHPRVCALTWGCEDLSAAIGATRTKRDGGYLPVFELARQLTLLAAKGARVQAIDGVYTDIKDLQGCAEETRLAREQGWDGKLTIHPDQIATVHGALAPTPEEVSDAHALVQFMQQCEQEGKLGAQRFKGEMVDAPHVARAQRIILRAADALAPATDLPDTALGKYWEDLPVGTEVRHALTRTVTEADNVFFTCMSMNPAPIHLDHEVSRKSPFGKPLMNSMFTLALLVGVSLIETTHGRTVANLGFDHVSFPAPVFVGDTVHAVSKVIAARPSGKNPKVGIITFEHQLYNQKDQLVVKAVRNAMLFRKPQ